MAETELPTLKWGVVGCGEMSSWFVSDLCITDRPGATTRHIIQALGSSSKSKGSQFAAKHCRSHEPAIYDTYQDVYNDAKVDIVYIGTPHTLHLQNALDAIAAGKHVLCEKPITINARDAKRIADAAREKGVFMMEAVWTRFFPLVEKLHSLLHHEKVIGDIHTTIVEFGLDMPIHKADPNARTAVKALGAGSLLDIGMYSLTWASLVYDRSPAREVGKCPGLTAAMSFCNEAEPNNKVDEQVTILLDYPELKAQAICTASLLYQSRPEFAHINGTKGSISVGGEATSQPGFLVIRLSGQQDDRLDFEVPGFGYHYQADAIAEDIRAGRQENAKCSWSDTLMIMSQMDSARSMCGLRYEQDK